MHGGGAHKAVDADLIARAIIAAAISYGDDPIRALTALRGPSRRCLLPAAAGIADAASLDFAGVAHMLEVNPHNGARARKDGGAAYLKAYGAAAEATRYALRSREFRVPVSTVVRATRDLAVDRVEIPVEGWSPPPSGIEALGDQLTADSEPAAFEPLPPIVGGEPVEDRVCHVVASGNASATTVRLEEANAVRLDADHALANSTLPRALPRPALPSPYSPDRPRPAPASPPPRPRPQAAAPRQAPPRRVTEVVQLKPVTDSIVRHAKAQIENGLDLGECADFFDVDVEVLETRLRAVGVKL